MVEKRGASRARNLSPKYLFRKQHQLLHHLRRLPLLLSWLPKWKHERRHRVSSVRVLHDAGLLLNVAHLN